MCTQESLTQQTIRHEIDFQHSSSQRLNETLAAALELLRQRDLGAIADVALEQLSRTQTAPRIVVVGETKRGKSSLVNALAGWADLSPVGVDETSATYLSVIPLPDPAAAPWAEVVLVDGTRREIDLSQVATYADLAQIDEAQRILPVGVDVHVRPGPLGDVVLTDSPGIGGIGGVRGRMNQRLASETGCLVFVLDAGAPLTRIELDYLDECAGSVENVVVAVTMIDKYPDQWRSVVDDVRHRLLRHSERLGRFPVMGVSAHAALAVQALPPGSPMGDRLMEASGFSAFIDELRTRDPRRFSPVINALRTTSTALNGELELVSLQEHMYSSDPQVEAELQTHQDELHQLQSQQERWSLELERDLGRLRADLAREIPGRLDQLGDLWRRRIERTPMWGHKEYVRATSLDMAADYRLVREEMAERTSEGLQAIVQRLFGELIPKDLHLTLTTPIPLQQWEPNHVAPKVSLADRGVLMTAAVGAGMAARIASVALLGPVAGPVAVVGAGAWVAFNLAYRTKRIDRQSLTSELTRTLSAERTMIMDQIDNHIRELKPELVVAYRGLLKSSNAQLQSLIRDAEAARTTSEASRQQAAAALAETANRIRVQLREIDEALAAHR